jgi:ATP-dependent Clp protease ATP-binding subunit ClpA
MTREQKGFFDRTCVDLVQAACGPGVRETWGRDEEARRVVALLREKRSVLLVGPPGVGKTAIVNRVAALIAAEAPDWPKGLYAVSSASIIATAQGYIGQWQAQLQLVIDGVRARDAALFYSDIWVTPGAGRTSGSSDNIWDALEPLLAQRQLTLLCECQPDVARAMERRMPGMLDRFVRIDVRVFDEEQARAVLRGCARASASGAPEGEQWSDDSLARVQELTDRFQPYRAQPGKGLALIDRVVHYRREKLRRGEDEAISPALVERVFSVYSGLPLFVLSDQTPLRKSEASDFFRSHVIGQDQAIAPIVEAIALYKAGLNDPRRPIASFLFVGPTGVGKTELARTLAKYLFGSPDRLLRLDMSEYRDYHGFQMLVGDPKRPEERARLCDPVREQPFQVVLLDEFEKGHSNISDLLLQVFDAGRLTTPDGVVVDFSSTIVILTSNLGSDLRRGQIGLRSGVTDERAELIDAALESAFRPEFLNRLDRIVHFRALVDDDLRRVARRELGLLAERRGLRGRRVTLDVDDSVIDQVVRDLDRKYGARGLRRMLERRVAIPVALALAERASTRSGSERVRVRLDDAGAIAVEVFADEPEARPRKAPQPPRVTWLTGEESGLRLTPSQARERLQQLRAELDALMQHVRIEDRRRDLERMAEEHAHPDFWSKPETAAAAFEQYDRLLFQVRRLDRLVERTGDLDQQLAAGRGSAAVIDAIADLAARVEEADLELRHFGQPGAQDDADALVRLRPELGDDPAAVALVMQNLWDIYAGWASSGTRKAELLYVAAEGGIATPLLVGAVSGPLAFGYLRREAGQHRFRLRTEDQTVVVRAEVYPAAPFDAAAPMAPREVVQQSFALKLALADGQRIRSAVIGRGADGQLLPLQNDRDLSENRLICRRLVASIDAFPGGGRAFTTDPLVRTYDFGPQPRVKDHATDHTTGRLKDVLEGDIDVLLRQRIRRLPL